MTDMFKRHFVIDHHSERFGIGFIVCNCGCGLIAIKIWKYDLVWRRERNIRERWISAQNNDKPTMDKTAN